MGAGMDNGGTETNHGGGFASFDIFDTVLTRRVADPRSAFLLLGRRLHSAGKIECSAHAFAKAREEAEVRTFRNSGGLDSSVSLKDIYCELANALHWSVKKRSELYVEELQLESELLVGLADGQRRVRQARARGQRIVYVSDMYLPSDYLEQRLRENDLFLLGDTLIVSNEREASKASGRLWPLVLSEIGAEPTDVHHIGNDARSDGKTARKSGLSTLVLEANNPNRYESMLERHRDSTDGLSSALAGASRLARLDSTNDADPALVDVAAGVVAPFVIGNLLWTLEVAQKENLAELFFVARDGQLLCDVARILAPKVGYAGKITYVYGSRQAWTLGGLTEIDVERLTSVIPDTGDVAMTLRDAFARLGVAPEEISLPLARAGFHRATWGRQLVHDQPLQLRALICEDPDISRAVRDRAKTSRELVLAYLESVGAVTDNKIGFVDLGTGATLFNSLGAILGSVGQEPPLGFYFGLRSKIADAGYGLPLTYVRNEDERLGFLRTPGLLTMVELACTADHGSVIGYDDVDGVVVPRFDEHGNDPVVEWGLPVVRDTVCRVADELLLSPDLIGSIGIDLRPAILDVFKLFWNSPTTNEARVWGAYPFEDGWGDQSYRHPIARARGLFDAVRPQPYRHWWEQGSSQLSGPVTRKAFESRSRAIDVLKKVRKRLPVESS